MSPCFGVKIVTPEVVNDLDIDCVFTQLTKSEYLIEIRKAPQWSKCWQITFKTRLKELIFITGSKLYRKTIVDEVLTNVTSIQNSPHIMDEVNESIDEGLKDAISVSELKEKRQYEDEYREHYNHSYRSEIGSEIAKSSYLHIGDIGNVMDGGYRYIIDIPAFVDSITKK